MMTAEQKAEYLRALDVYEGTPHAGRYTYEEKAAWMNGWYAAMRTTNDVGGKVADRAPS